jgi:hypothetical protein
MEFKMDMSEKAEKAREHTRKYYRPTGGWAMRASQYRMEISVEQVDRADQS